MPVPTRADIAKRARELKIMFLALSLAAPLSMDPSLPVLQYLREKTGPGAEDVPFNVGGRPGDADKLTFSAREVLTEMSQLRGQPVKDLLAITMIFGGTIIGDMIDKGGFRDYGNPLLEFARHFRNACAHGGLWEFRNGEPRNPATCRDVALDARMNEQPAPYTTVSPRLYVEFFDDIVVHFGTT